MKILVDKIPKIFKGCCFCSPGEVHIFKIGGKKITKGNPRCDLTRGTCFLYSKGECPYLKEVK